MTELRPIERLVQFVSGGPLYASSVSEARDIDDVYRRACSAGGDISAHLPTLSSYAARSESILELGVNYGLSSVAFLVTRPSFLMSIDVDWSHIPRRVLELKPYQTVWTKLQADSRINSATCDFDLVFVDTLHTADQVRAEIATWEPVCKRWMIFHDTATYAYGDEGSDGKVGINLPIMDLLNTGKWAVREHNESSNGLTVLQRKVRQ